MIDKLSGSNPQNAITMLQTMILEESAKTPSLTNEYEAGCVKTFLGFMHFTYGQQQLQDGGQAFNLSNVDIPSDWVLLDSQSTLHLFLNPNHAMICNTRTGPVTMSIFCNAGTANTTIIADVVGLKGGPAWIHPHGLSNVLSISKVTKQYRVTFESTNGNEFILQVGRSRTMHFKQSLQGIYCYNTTDHQPSGTTPITTDTAPI